MFQVVMSIFMFFILVVLQFVIPKYFSIINIYPNFILIYIVFTGLNKGSIKGELTGFFYGLIWDILSTDIFGIRTLTFTISGYLSGRFNKKLDKNQPLTQVIVMLFSLLIVKFGTSIIYLIVRTETPYPYFEITYNTWGQMLCNLILAPIIFKGLFYISEKKLIKN